MFMQCAVYDTYVRKKDGNVMHFDVVVEAKTPHEKRPSNLARSI